MYNIVKDFILIGRLFHRLAPSPEKAAKDIQRNGTPLAVALVDWEVSNLLKNVESS